VIQPLATSNAPPHLAPQIWWVSCWHCALY